MKKTSKLISVVLIVCFALSFSTNALCGWIENSLFIDMFKASRTNDLPKLERLYNEYADRIDWESVTPSIERDTEVSVLNKDGERERSTCEVVDKGPYEVILFYLDLLGEFIQKKPNEPAYRFYEEKTKFDRALDIAEAAGREIPRIGQVGEGREGLYEAFFRVIQQLFLVVGNLPDIQPRYRDRLIQVMDMVNEVFRRIGIDDRNDEIVRLHVSIFSQYLLILILNRMDRTAKEVIHNLHLQENGMFQPVVENALDLFGENESARRRFLRFIERVKRASKRRERMLSPDVVGTNKTSDEDEDDEGSVARSSFLSWAAGTLGLGSDSHSQ